VEVSQDAVDECNRTTRFHCAEEFVSWKGETRSHWFERGQEPEDTWEKSEAGKKTMEARDAAIRDLMEMPISEKPQETDKSESSARSEPKRDED
jgi:hypothetical protein